MAEAAPESLPPPVGGRPRALFWGLLVLGGAMAAGFWLLFLHRPQGQFFYPRCSFHSLTGWLCPGCGGLRAVHELLHGRLLEAVRCNALFLVVIPAALAWWGWRRRQGRPLAGSPRTVWLGFAVLVGFTLLRNVPFPPFTFLAP